MARPVFIDKIPYRHSVFDNYNLNFSNICYWWSPVDSNIFTTLKQKKLFNKFVTDMISNDAYLVIDESQDPLHIRIIDNMYKKDLYSFFKKYKISWDKLIFLTPTPNKMFFDSATDNYTIDIHPRIVSRPYRHIFYNNLFEYTKGVYLECDVEKKKTQQATYHFICMMYRDAVPRMLINTLFHTNNLTNNLISHNRFIPKVDDSDKKKFNLVMSAFSATDGFDFSAFLKYGFLRHKLDSIVDKPRATHSYDLHTRLSSQCCFEIIMETSVSHNNMFITEKTIKSFLSKNVFIIIGNPHSLTWLKSLGFRTFSDIIDESYDNEKVFFKRFMLAFEEIKKLCSLDVITLKNKITCMNEVVEHNYNHFLNTTWDFNLPKKLNKYLDQT